MPSARKVSIDNQMVGTTPLPHSLYVTAGEHDLQVTDGDKEPFNKRLSAVAGSTVIIEANCSACDSVCSETKSWAYRHRGSLIAGALTVASGGSDGGNRSRSEQAFDDAGCVSSTHICANGDRLHSAHTLSMAFDAF